jgi:hypothetical protein
LKSKPMNLKEPSDPSTPIEERETTVEERTELEDTKEGMIGEEVIRVMMTGN